MRAARLLACVAAAASLLAAAPVDAARAADRPGLVVRYPSASAPDLTALNAAIRDPDVGTIVFERGTNPFSAPITVFRREGLTLRGATSRPEDTILESTSTVAVLLDECRDVDFRDLTIRSTAGTGEAIRLQAVRSTSVDGFADDVAVRDCRLEGWIPVRATVRAHGLTVADSRLVVTQSQGVGLLWEDGSDLHVTRTRFATSEFVDSVGAVAALLVRGPFVSESEGDRARGIVLTRNRVDGNFHDGFNLSDVVDARIRANRITFSEPTYVNGTLQGRIGIAVRRATASSQTEDFEVRGNAVHGAHTAVWIAGTGAGSVVANDLRRSGCASCVVELFQDSGCAVRIDLTTPLCDVRVDGNDCRELRTAAPAPACVVSPVAQAAECFPEGARNRVDRGRTVFQESTKR
jgi:hypothetical protein